jgi:TRAP-type C4-dicarboxylate transport system substrate-binding protein
MQGYYESLAKKGGIRVVALNWFDGARHMIGKAPYPKPSDLKGVKMRVPPVETWLKTFEPMGVVAVTVEAAEAYTALSQGVVTAAESPLTGIADKKWYEPAKHITLTGHFNLFVGWVMSEKVFQSLSEKDQAILMEEFRKGGQELAAESEALQKKIRADFEAQGVQFHDPDLEAYRKVTSGFWTNFPDWPEGLYDKIRSAATGK